jgi:hypothetical protein
MKAEDWHLFVMCHGDNVPRYSSAATLHRMRLDAAKLSVYDQIDLVHDGWILDSQGRSISWLNKWWSELTGIYWAVNNSSHDFIGNAQYRRKWRDDGLAPSSSSVLYIPEPEHFHCSVAEQYAGGHKGMDGIDQVLIAADKGQLPLSKEDLEAAFEQKIFYGHIMARGSHQLYCQFMQALLDCMWPIWDDGREKIMQIEGYNCRYISFLAERIMTALVLHRDKVWPSMSIETAPIEFFGP